MSRPPRLINVRVWPLPEMIENKEVYQFRVNNMTGDAFTFEATTFKELRVRLAIQAGVLCSCIVLLKGVDKAVVEDFYEIGEVFHGSMQPYELFSINNEESVKKEVAAWRPAQWFEVVEAHKRYGDENIVERAKPLKQADQEFERKMSEWAREIIIGNHEFFKYREKDVKTAIAFGIDVVAITDEKGYTFLHLAARHGLDDLLRVLLGAGGNVDVAVEWGTTPLHVAAQFGHRHTAELLIDAGADVNKADHAIGFTAIFQAASHGHDDVVAFLIDAGADVNRVDMYGRTPLHEASRHGHIKVISLLMRHGANLNSVDEEGRRPSDVASNDQTRWNLLLRGQY